MDWHLTSYLQLFSVIFDGKFPQLKELISHASIQQPATYRYQRTAIDHVEFEPHWREASSFEASGDGGPLKDYNLLKLINGDYGVVRGVHALLPVTSGLYQARKLPSQFKE